jgi:cellulose synthase/poly-beta-1,6-N-acetylglucosamine synthase-like glycosyltransferase
LPLPLGGSSNHFRTAALDRAGAWDPYNVTEDADLGMRLARFGYRSAIVRSSTYEEAPFKCGPWLRQRTRWFKGWLRPVNELILTSYING